MRARRSTVAALTVAAVALAIAAIAVAGAREARAELRYRTERWAACESELEGVRD